MERILCSAIKRLKRRECPNIYYEGQNDILDIEIGYRHADILHRFQGEVSKDPRDQGFYTSLGKYVDRIEGLRIAKEANQLKEGEFVHSQLYSENLY